MFLWYEMQLKKDFSSILEKTIGIPDQRINQELKLLEHIRVNNSDLSDFNDRFMDFNSLDEKSKEMHKLLRHETFEY